MALHFESRMRVERIDTPLDAPEKVGLAVAIQVTGPRIGTVDREGDRFAVAAQLPGQVEDGVRVCACVQQQVDVSSTRCVVDQVETAVARPVDGAKGLGPVFLAADDAVIDLAPIGQQQTPFLAQSPCAIVINLDEQSQLALFVVDRQIAQTISIPVGEGASRAPEERRRLVEGIGMVG